MACLELTYLGSFQVSLDGRPVTRFRSANTRGLLVYLSMQVGRPISREVLATLFWPDESDAVAKTNLRQILFQLRKSLQQTKEGSEQYLIINRQSVEFSAEASFDLDVSRFLKGVEEKDWATTADYFGGELLPGFTCDSLEFEDWLLVEREQLNRLGLEALFNRTEQLLQNGGYPAARRMALDQIGIEPWRESAHRQLMRALALNGERQAALAQFDKLKEILEEELGVEPELETEELYEQIGKNELKALKKEPVPAVTQQKIIAQFQAPSMVKHFVGRIDLLAEVQSYLKGEGRIALLHGMGGAGKTTLATQLAYRLRNEFPDGVYWVDLRHLVEREEEQIENNLQSILAGIVQHFVPGFETSDDVGSLSGQLRNILAHNKLLLIVDNAEIKSQLDYFLPPSSGESKLIVTTRVDLISRSDQRSFEVASFSAKESIGLLSKLIGQGSTDALETEKMEQLCDMLGHLPLAIQIVGSDLAQATDITVDEYIELLEDENERLVEDFSDETRGIRATFELSYSRLSVDQKLIFAALSIFPGVDFSVDAVAATFQLNKIKTKRQLSYLHRGSLLEQGRPGLDPHDRRYRLHPLVKEFSREKLHEYAGKEASFRQNAILYFSNLAYEHRYDGYEKLDFDWENCATTLRWSLDERKRDVALITLEGLTAIRLGLVGFLDSRADWSLAVELLEEVVTAKYDAIDDLQLGCHIIKLGIFFFRLGKIEDAERWLETGLNQLEKCQPSDIRSLYLSYGADFMARVALQKDELEEVLDWSVRAVDALDVEAYPELAQEKGYANIRHAEMLGRMRELAETLKVVESGLSMLPQTSSSALAVAHIVAGAANYLMGNRPEAHVKWSQGLVISEGIGDLHRTLSLKHNLALLDSEIGNFKSSIPIQIDVIEAFEKIGDMRKVALNLSNVAEDLIFVHRFDEAEGFLLQALEIVDQHQLFENKLKILINLFQLNLASNQIKEAKAIDQQLSTYQNTITFQGYRDEILYHKARLSLLEDEPRLAGQYLDGLIAQQDVSDFEKCRYLRLLGQCLVQINKQEEAVKAFSDSLTLAYTNGYQYELAMTQLVYGQLMPAGQKEKGPDRFKLLASAKKYFQAQEIDSLADQVDRLLS